MKQNQHARPRAPADGRLMKTITRPGRARTPTRAKGALEFGVGVCVSTRARHNNLSNNQAAAQWPASRQLAAAATNERLDFSLVSLAPGPSREPASSVYFELRPRQIDLFTLEADELLSS